MKKFFKKTDGFTLVELIVVIAILGILAGVGTVGYSGYVKKANMAADQQLVSEVENALLLASYSNELTADGYVVLSDSAPDYDENTEIEKALQNAFGTNLENLTLKYDGWGASAEMLALAQADAYSASVNDSSYITGVGTKELLNDVQTCVSALAGLIGSMYDADDFSSFVDTLSSDYKNVLTEAGYEAGADGKWEGVDNTVLTNAIVFGLSSQYSENDGTAIAERFYNTRDLMIMSDIDNAGLSELAAWYASAEAYVAWANDPTLNQSFGEVENYLSNPAGIASTTEVRTKMNGLKTSITAYMQSNPSTSVSYFIAPEGEKSQAQLDGESYVNIMRTVNELSGEYKNKDSLSTGALFTDGAVLNQIDSYVAAIALANSLTPDQIESLGDDGSWVAVLVSGSKTWVLPAMH